MNKMICVINGKGGIGKDTLIDALSCEVDMIVYNISSIDPIRELCSELTKGCEKDLAQRKLLSGMKEVVDEYYKEEHGISYTQKYLQEEVKAALFDANDYNYDNAIIFVHIREPENIKEFLRLTSQELNHNKRYHLTDKGAFVRDKNIKLTTLLVESDRAKKSYGNASDDKVADYDYDYHFVSNGSIDEENERFVSFVRDIIETTSLTKDKSSKVCERDA